LAPVQKSEVEVDFLLIHKKKLIAIEVKSGGAFREAWCKGLRAIAQLPGLQRRIIVFPEGEALKTKDGIEGFSFAGFSEILAKGNLFR
jgi:hypothetical protein